MNDDIRAQDYQLASAYLTRVRQTNDALTLEELAQVQRVLTASQHAQAELRQQVDEARQANEAIITEAGEEVQRFRQAQAEAERLSRLAMKARDQYDEDRRAAVGREGGWKERASVVEAEVAALRQQVQEARKRRSASEKRTDIWHERADASEARYDHVRRVADAAERQVAELQQQLDATNAQPETVEAALRRVYGLGMSGCDLDALTDEEDKAVRRLLSALAREGGQHEAETEEIHVTTARAQERARLGELEKERDEARAELRKIAARFARRPALAEFATLADKAEWACATAGYESDRANRLDHDLAAAERQVAELTAQQARVRAGFSMLTYKIRTGEFHNPFTNAHLADEIDKVLALIDPPTETP